MRGLKGSLRREFGASLATLSNAIVDARIAMEMAQGELSANPDSVHCLEMARLWTQEFWVFARREEASLRQKSRVHWLELDDRNSTFFHRQVKTRIIRNGLVSVLNEVGTRVSDPAGVADIVVNYYRELLGVLRIG